MNYKEKGIRKNVKERKK